MELFGIIFLLFFLIAFGMIFFVLIKNISQWNKNNHSPRLTVPALVATKRTEVTHHHHHGANGAMHVSSTTSYYVTFQVESGDRMELHVGGNEYGMLVEGDFGRLSFQGTRYLGFEKEPRG